MKKILTTILLSFSTLMAFASRGKMHASDRLHYDLGPQPALDEVLIALGATLLCGLVMWLGVYIQEKVQNKVISGIGTAIGFVGLIGVGIFFLPCLLTIWFWIIFGGIAIIVIAIILIKKKVESIYAKRNPKPTCLDSDGYWFVNFQSATDSTAAYAYKEMDDVPKASYQMKITDSSNSVYKKDGVYYLCRYTYPRTYTPLEENPYYGNPEAGLWGQRKYRFKGKYENREIYFYMNIPEQDTTVVHNV